MSLDVCLYRRGFIHWDNGETEEINDCVMDLNITHNLNKMAIELGVYEYIWRPDEIGITFASELIEPLTNSLSEMKRDHEYYKKFNPSNGWGSFENLYSFIEKYLQKCKEFPQSYIEVSR